jgi:hypothetical protein
VVNLKQWADRLGSTHPRSCRLLIRDAIARPPCRVGGAGEDGSPSPTVPRIRLPDGHSQGAQAKIKNAIIGCGCCGSVHRRCMETSVDHCLAEAVAAAYGASFPTLHAEDGTMHRGAVVKGR